MTNPYDDLDDQYASVLHNDMSGDPDNYDSEDDDDMQASWDLHTDHGLPVCDDESLNDDDVVDPDDYNDRWDDEDDFIEDGEDDDDSDYEDEGHN